MFRKLLLFATLLLSANVLRAQDTFYDVDSIQQIEIFFSATNWDAILDANVASETYYEADMVIINGVSYTGVGVKYKGNSSYNPTRTKNPFHLKLDYIVNDFRYSVINPIIISKKIISNCFIKICYS